MLLYPFLFSSLLFHQFSSIPILILLSTISKILRYTHCYSPHYYFTNSLYTHSHSPHYYFNNSLLYSFLFSSVLFQQFLIYPLLFFLTTISKILFYTHSYSPQNYFNNSLSYPFLFSSLLFQQFSLCTFFSIATITIIPPLSICFASPTRLPTHHHMLLELNLEISKKMGTPVSINLNTFS